MNAWVPYRRGLRNERKEEMVDDNILLKILRVPCGLPQGKRLVRIVPLYFTLVYITVWAKPGFFTTMCNRKRNFEWIVKAGAASNRGLTSAERAQDALTPAEAAEIVKGFVDEDEHVRTRAYQYFTRCGYRAINFECKDRACRERAPDDEIGLEVFCSDMAPESVIRERMESRRVCARGYIHRTKELKRKYS